MSQALKLSFVVPVYNEVRRLPDFVEHVEKVSKNLGVDHETVIVDDGSVDRTYEAAQELARRYGSVRVVHYTPNEGKGYAIARGFARSNGDWVLITDVDMGLQMLAMFPTYLETMRKGADVVIASKRHPDALIRYPLRRRLFSRAFISLVRLLYGIRVSDTQAGFKLFKREVLERVIPRLLIKRYAYDVELLVNIWKEGFNIVEEPLIYRHKEERMRIRDIFWMAIDLLAIFYRLHFTDTYR